MARGTPVDTVRSSLPRESTSAHTFRGSGKAPRREVEIFTLNTNLRCPSRKSRKRYYLKILKMKRKKKNSRRSKVKRVRMRRIGMHRCWNLLTRGKS
jgi:hypothetical protein